jgi:hypothetical protein
MRILITPVSRAVAAISLMLGGALLPLAALADLKSTGRATDSIDIWTDMSGYGTTFGDTSMPTAWSGSGAGGNWSGGHIYASYNDGGNWCGGGSDSAIALLEVTAVNWTTKSSTAMSCVNGMSAYGNAPNVPAGWSDGASWKTFNILAYNGKIFWWPYRQACAPGCFGYQSTVITSPDKGLHWCNHETYAAHTGSPGCDSANWVATGDVPASNTHMAFGAAGSSNNPMARPIHVQFCQDETCNGMPFGADSYHYFTTLDGNNYMFAVCVAKGSEMDPTAYWYHTTGNANCSDTGSWTHTMGSAVRIQKQASEGADYYGYPSSIIYVPGAGGTQGQFMLTSYDAAKTRTMMMSSFYPWGPWKVFAMAPVDSQGTFVATNVAWLDSACSGCGTNPGRYDLTVMDTIYTHEATRGSFAFRKIPLAMGGPSTPNTPPAGKNVLGKLPIRVSKDGLNKSLIGNGLVYALGFDDGMYYASSDYTYLGMYTRDLLGSGNCLVGAGNPAGSMIFGAQNGTVSLSYLAAGLYVGDASDAYVGQLSANKANCAWSVPLSGNAAFTVIWIGSLDNVSKNQGMIWEFQDTSTAHTGVSLGTNINVEGGSHVDAYDNNYTVRTNPGLTSGQYNMITFVKAAGAFGSTSKIIFGNGASTKTWCASGCGSAWNGTSGTDSGNLNLSASTKLLMHCAGFGISSRCTTGGSGPVGGGTDSFFAIYNRALSGEEVNRNYIALKAAMAQAPRSITVQ